MSNTTYTQKIYKTFDNFTEEEQWLQSMLQDGWILINFNNDNPDEENYEYIFEPIPDNTHRNGTYRIDFRSFSNEDEFYEYNTLFEEAGWTAIGHSKQEPKRIFYTHLPHANQNIFSDQESYIEREKRQMSKSLQNMIIGTSLSVILFIIHAIYRSPMLGGLWILILGSTIPSMVSYYKHRKIYKSLVIQQS
jgi:hypothetical protein